MFIVCPSCSGPYSLPAEQIAPLVQTACPHCEYRVILDFEAANEPALREAGHQFAQGFESVEAYAAVYDHVTSQPDVQPRLGVTTVPASASVATTPLAATPLAATGSDARNAASARPLQPRPADLDPSASVSQSTVRSAGTKTILQVPSKKPVSMAPHEPASDSPSLSGAATSSTSSTSSISSMRAGRGVDIVDEPRPDAHEQEPADRKPPHTPPVTSVVSSGPVAVAPPATPDVAAQSGAHVKPDAKPDVKAVIPPVKPEGSSLMWIIIVGLLVVAGILLYVFVFNK